MPLCGVLPLPYGGCTVEGLAGPTVGCHWGHMAKQFVLTAVLASMQSCWGGPSRAPTINIRGWLFVVIVVRAVEL